MSAKISAAILAIVIAQTALGDATIEQAQQALKDQGFYYGEITGQKDADTTAAIRRFQIRSGLQVTGELNPETLQALNSHAAVRAPTANATATPRVAISPEQGSTDQPIPRSGQIYSPPPGLRDGSVFSHTPYEMAPPEVQRRVVRGAQVLLRSRGYFKGKIDGIYGPELEFSIRAYQSRTGIAPNGRLDMDTLASLGLLPGQQLRPRELPPRRILPRSLDEPPVRGEWIPENRDRDEDD